MGDDLAAFKRAMAEEGAKRLLAAAVFFQTQLRMRLNKSNPRPYEDSSKPGEYPRARTGFGRDNVIYEPTSIQEVAKTQSVRVGYTVNAFYMAILEVARDRLGITDCLEDLRQQLAALAVSGDVKK